MFDKSLEVWYSGQTRDGQTWSTRSLKSFIVHDDDDDDDDDPLDTADTYWNYYTDGQMPTLSA